MHLARQGIVRVVVWHKAQRGLESDRKRLPLIQIRKEEGRQVHTGHVKTKGQRAHQRLLHSEHQGRQKSPCAQANGQMVETMAARPRSVNALPESQIQSPLASTGRTTGARMAQHLPRPSSSLLSPGIRPRDGKLGPVAVPSQRDWFTEL